MSSEAPGQGIRFAPLRPQDAPIKLSLQCSDDHTLTVDPWPFDIESFRFDVSFRRVTDRPFASEEDFRAVYAATELESMPVSIRPKQ